MMGDAPQQNEQRMVIEQPGGWFRAINAVVIGDVKIGANASVWFQSVIRGDVAAITIGEWTNIQDACMVHCDTGHENHIGAYVTVGHRAILHGSRVGDRALIGMGAILLGGTVIGEESVIAAGCVVKEGFQVPPRTLVAGVPGKIIREITETERGRLLESARRYRGLAELWATHDTVTPALVAQYDAREGLGPFKADKSRPS